MSYVKYIADVQHCNEVLSKVASVKKSLWIGTADIKDLHVKEPGPIFREEFDRYPILSRRLERALCPRVHFKMMIFDLDEVYVGSANLTGAGIGMKSAKTRNFEAGILTDESALLDAAIEQFDSVWAGFRCKECSRKKFCGDPIIP